MKHKHFPVHRQLIGTEDCRRSWAFHAVLVIWRFQLSLVACDTVQYRWLNWFVSQELTATT